MTYITVFRYGHRPERDKRITTHVALAARAFGAHEILIDTKSIDLENTINDVTQRFGGTFKIKTGVKWREIVRQWDGIIIHLTMYGEGYEKVIKKIKHADKVLIIVGSQKVPGEFYHIADYNVAIGNQPHSEVSALAVFLQHLKKGL